MEGGTAPTPPRTNFNASLKYAFLMTAGVAVRDTSRMSYSEDLPNTVSGDVIEEAARAHTAHPASAQHVAAVQNRVTV